MSQQGENGRSWEYAWSPVGDCGPDIPGRYAIGVAAHDIAQGVWEEAADWDEPADWLRAAHTLRGASWMAQSCGQWASAEMLYEASGLAAMRRQYVIGAACRPGGSGRAPEWQWQPAEASDG